mmetsp:Transcript_36762/g.66074  ORF Transcript_36762/g.66074 Transcript_36762/m.66074 type:complete len:505 (+) Transcript_36762:101-1615(+)
MLSNLLRPVEKQATRLFFAGTNNAVGSNAVADSPDRDASFTPAVSLTPPTTVEDTSSNPFPTPFGFNRAFATPQPCLWQQPSYQWPSWQENASAFAGHSSSGPAAEANSQTAGPFIAAALPVLPTLNGSLPFGTAMLPVLMPIGCFAPGFQQQGPQPNLPGPAPLPVKTGASRRQRRKQHSTSSEEAAPVSALVGAEDLIVQQVERVSISTERSASPVDCSETTEAASEMSLWPPTPESTPPSSPREALPSFENLGGEQIAEDAHQSAWRSMISSSAWDLASTKSGSLMLQRALDEANHVERSHLLDQLRGRVREATASPHANYFLQKCIEVMPPEKLGFIFEEMQGHVVVLSRHRYGCRVLERLLEHCPAAQTVGLIEEVLAAASQLCRHVFGNFVIQHIFEHGTSGQKRLLADMIIGDIRRLARHRVASHVVRCALIHCCSEDKNRLAQALTAEPAELADLARHHWGSFVVRELRHQFHGQFGVGLCTLTDSGSVAPKRLTN